MGDVQRGDGGVGVHLVECLAQMHWPAGVVFCRASEVVPKRAESFARIVLVDALEGTEAAGSLYSADPEELLASSLKRGGCGLGLLSMISPATRKRLAVFGIQPRTQEYGSSLSREVAASIPVVLPYLRAFILGVLAELAELN